MDVFADISAVQSRIAEISGSPPASGVSRGGGVNAFAGMVSQALSAGTGLRPTYGMPAAVNPFGGGIGGSAIGMGDVRGAAPVPPAEIDSLVASNSAAYAVDPALIRAVIANESGFDAHATSRTGAQGLMQLEPETAAQVGVTDSYDPAQNVAGGTRYLKGLLDRFHGDVHLAVAAYNAGPGAVEKYGGIPPYAETQHYVAAVLDSYQRYRTQ